MTEQEYCRRAEELKPRLYRTALACLGGESAAAGGRPPWTPFPSGGRRTLTPCP